MARRQYERGGDGLRVVGCDRGPDGRCHDPVQGSLPRLCRALSELSEARPLWGGPLLTRGAEPSRPSCRPPQQLPVEQRGGVSLGDGHEPAKPRPGQRLQRACRHHPRMRDTRQSLASRSSDEHATAPVVRTEFVECPDSLLAGGLPQSPSPGADVLGGLRCTPASPPLLAQASAERVRQCDDDALGTAEVPESVLVLVPHDLGHQFRAVGLSGRGSTGADVFQMWAPRARRPRGL